MVLDLLSGELRKKLLTTLFWRLTKKPLCHLRFKLLLLLFWNNAKILNIWDLYYSVHHLLICNFRCFVTQCRFLPTPSSFWESLDYIFYVPSSWEWESHFQINGKKLRLNSYLLPRSHFILDKKSEMTEALSFAIINQLIPFQAIWKNT